MLPRPEEINELEVIYITQQYVNIIKPPTCGGGGGGSNDGLSFGMRGLGLRFALYRLRYRSWNDWTCPCLGKYFSGILATTSKELSSTGVLLESVLLNNERGVSCDVG